MIWNWSLSSSFCCESSGMISQVCAAIIGAVVCVIAVFKFLYSAPFWWRYEKVIAVIPVKSVLQQNKSRPVNSG